MNSDHPDAACLSDAGKPGCVAIAIIPACAHLQGNRQIDRLDCRFQDTRSMGLVAHQRRASVAIDHFLYRTAEIDVDDPRAAVGIELCRFGHHPRLAAGELNRHRLFFRAASRHRQRLPGFSDHRLAGDHFGHNKAGPQVLDEAAKR